MSNTVDDFTEGNAVLYVPSHAHGDTNHKDCERGVVTGRNQSVVFVRYGDDMHPQATDPITLRKVI